MKAMHASKELAEAVEFVQWEAEAVPDGGTAMQRLIDSAVAS